MGGIPCRNSKGERLNIYIGIIDILQSYRSVSDSSGKRQKTALSAGFKPKPFKKYFFKKKIVII